MWCVCANHRAIHMVRTNNHKKILRYRKTEENPPLVRTYRKFAANLSLLRRSHYHRERLPFLALFHLLLLTPAPWDFHLSAEEVWNYPHTQGFPAVAGVLFCSHRHTAEAASVFLLLLLLLSGHCHAIIHNFLTSHLLTQTRI